MEQADARQYWEDNRPPAPTEKATAGEAAKIVRNLTACLDNRDRLAKLTPLQLIAATLASDAADFDVTIELMNRVLPHWEQLHEKTIEAATLQPTPSAQEAAERAAREIAGHYWNTKSVEEYAAVILRHFQAVPAQSPEPKRCVPVGDGYPATPPATHILAQSPGGGETPRTDTFELSSLGNMEPSPRDFRAACAFARILERELAHPPSVKIGDGKDGGESWQAEISRKDAEWADRLRVALLRDYPDDRECLSFVLKASDREIFDHVGNLHRGRRVVCEIHDAAAKARAHSALSAQSPQADAGREEK